MLEATKQLEFDKYWNDVTQELHGIGRRVRYYFWFDSVQNWFCFEH
jgi:hypothetical protein